MSGVTNFPDITTNAITLIEATSNKSKKLEIIDLNAISSLFFSVTKNIILLLIKNADFSRTQRLSHVAKFHNGGICIMHFK